MLLYILAVTENLFVQIFRSIYKAVDFWPSLCTIVLNVADLQPGRSYDSRILYWNRIYLHPDSYGQ